jgi:hypothetical protein
MQQNIELEKNINENPKPHQCRKAIASLLLSDIGEEHIDMIDAMTEFCGGMGDGEICGALAGAIAMLHICNSREATDRWQDEFMDWFYERFDAYDCREIIANSGMCRDEICPKLILETCMRLRLYLDQHPKSAKR